MSLSILRASAGSGKTYALTKYYLELLLHQQNAAYFRSILAVTFTNKATQEMKERILSELEKLAAGAIDKGMGQDLQESMALNPLQLQQRAKGVLTAILHNYSHFSVSTIDSFFQRVVRSFAREADLPAAYQIEMNIPRVLEELTDKLMEKAEKDKHLRNWLVRFSSQQLREGKSWDIRKSLHKLIGEIVKEGFMEQAEEMVQLSRKPEVAQTFLDQLWKIRLMFEDKMRELGEAGLDLIAQHDLSIGDFSGGDSRSIAKFLTYAVAGSSYTPTDTLRKTVAGEKNWCAQKSPKKKQIEHLVFDGGLLQVFEGLINHTDAKSGEYASACTVLEHFTTCAILGHYMSLLREYRQENNLLLISDVAELLNGIMGEEDAPFIYEKIGSRYDHFLIDEFQDTSRLHWRNFLPLVENSVASGQPSLIVGDPKQSIYRWRGGDLRLMLQEVSSQLPGAITSKLEHNWRSCPAVIDFNNVFFKAAAGLIAEEAAQDTEDHELPYKEQEIIAGLRSNISAVYEQTAQLFPEIKKKKDCRKGYVRVQLAKDQARSKLKLSFKEQAKALLLQNIRDVQSQGYALQDIALLVRSNGDARMLASFLAEKEYDVLSEEALLLNTSAGVRLLVNLLQYLHNFRHKPALAAALSLYNQNICQSPTAAELLHHCGSDLSELTGLLPEAFIREHVSLSRLPLYDLCSKLCRIFKLESLPEEEHYLEAFLNEVHRYSHEEKGDIGGFLQWWEEEGVKQSLKREQAPDAIRILTVHKSKGLQYPVVIVPFCNWSLDVDTQGKTQIIWAGTKTLDGKNCKMKFFEDLQLSKVPVSYSSKLSDTCFGFDYLQEKYQAYLDNLNLLYVALTRAEEALLITAQEVGSSSTSRHMGWMLGQYLQENPETEELSTTTEEQEFEYKQCAFGELEKTTKESVDASRLEHPRHVPLKDWSSLLQLRRHAKPLHLEQHTEAAAKVDYGTMVHEVLSQVKGADSLQNILDRMQLRGEISRKDADVLQNKMTRLLKDPQIASWFSPEWEVLNEQPILSADGSIHRPDRILLKDQLAVVIDYKTGSRKLKYKNQLRRYTEQLRQMGFQQVEGYLLYLEEDQPVEQVVVRT